jgi:hypothetical protein
MENNITITKEQFDEYQKLKQIKQVDKELLSDIAGGIKDILTGNVKEAQELNEETEMWDELSDEALKNFENNY